MKLRSDMNVIDFEDRGESSGFALIFDNDADRINHANNILNMPMKEGKRAYLVYDENISEEDKEVIMSYTKSLVDGNQGTEG
jgi:hypothetical protein